MRALTVYLGILAASGLFGEIRSAYASETWNPERTWVFIVGLLEWEDSQIWKPFPAAKVNRRDAQLAECFRAMGVPREQVTYLQDAAATQRRIKQEFVQLLDQTDAGDLLIFYFCGHGARDRSTGVTWFANYDAGKSDESCLRVESIFEAVEEHFSGDRALFFADCCHSGALYDEVKKRRNDDVSYAALTSSYTHNSSTGNWTFSDCLLAGLRGDPQVDSNENGVVDLGELAAYAELEMAFCEEQKSMFQPGKELSPRLQLAKTKGKRNPEVNRRMEVEWKGKWYKAKSIDARPGAWLIHYPGYESRWDEWIGPARIRNHQTEQFSKGTRVEVRWTQDQKWYPATVLEGWQGLHLIRYEGYDSSWDEWVKPRDVRRAP